MSDFFSDASMAFLASMRFAVSHPEQHMIIKGVTGDNIEEALADLQREDPDGYALLMEHLPIERKP